MCSGFAVLSSAHGSNDQDSYFGAQSACRGVPLCLGLRRCDGVKSPQFPESINTSHVLVSHRSCCIKIWTAGGCCRHVNFGCDVRNVFIQTVP